MNRVVKILMERDDMTEEDAREMIQDTKDEIEDAIACGDYDLVEDLMSGDLGLEMDYVFDVLGVM